MVEHRPWIGPKSKLGISGQQIAIVGYSHHRNPDHVDGDRFTIGVVRKFLSCELERNALFSRVPGYFGYESRKDRKEFWNRVWFFNFVPECIGTDEQKYATAKSDLVERAKQRFKRILQEDPIQKVFVFTTKGWRACPCTDEEKAGKDCASLGPEFKKVTWGTYTIGRRKVLAFGFRHPQGADKRLMTAAVSRALLRKSD
jgi:hypothetical protein